MDIMECATSADDPSHIMCALPTGFGKTLPMLLLGHLLPPGGDIIQMWIDFCSEQGP